jgi:small subunit ribosomal protein S1
MPTTESNTASAGGSPDLDVTSLAAGESVSPVSHRREAAADDTAADDTAADDTADGDTADGDASEGDADDAAEGTAAEGEGTEGKKKRRRRRKKKVGPPGQSAEKKPANERAPFNVGEEVFGRVTAVLDDAVMVDLSGKALGVFDRLEMEADDLVPVEGDRFLARVHQDGSRGGLIVLTRKPLREEASKVAIEKAAKEGSVVNGLVTGVIKGGVDVDLEGLRAFAPASGMDLHPQNANFASLVGKRLDFKVSQYSNNGRDVVVTRRPMLEAEAHERRKRALGLLVEGQVVTGVVRTVVEWGAFVALPDAENLEGLIHATEAAHDQRAKLAELFKPGERIEVKIIKIDERGKIWLSRKAVVSDPWQEAKEKYPAGAKFTAKVTRVESFGAFCDLDGVEGLIHISDLSLTKIDHAKEVVKEGDELEVVVHQFDVRSHKLSLHPALSGERANEPKQRIARNSDLRVEIVKAEPTGLIVRVLGVTGRAARGYVPAAQTGTERGSDLRKRFAAGQQLMASVLDIDPRRGEPKLSISKFHENEERSAHRDYRKKLAQEGNFGTLGDLLKRSLGK